MTQLDDTKNVNLRIVTCFGTLMQLAREEAKARLYGTPQEYVQAKAKHENYRQLCLRSDQMRLGVMP